jgi:hypothetical protein
MIGMDVELLVTYDCPNEDAAVALLRLALYDVGLTRTRIRTTVVTTPEQAATLGFGGSPTILIDGRDPFARPDQAVALACRIHRGVDGPGGVPDLDALRQAIKQAAAATGKGTR